MFFLVQNGQQIRQVKTSVKLGKAVRWTLRRYTESKEFSTERFRKMENQYKPAPKCKFRVSERFGGMASQEPQWFCGSTATCLG